MEHEPIIFEGIGLCYYRKVDYRPARAGEYYLSGAIVQGWFARNGTNWPAQIVVPTFHAAKTISYKKLDPVKYLHVVK